MEKVNKNLRLWIRREKRTFEQQISGSRLIKNEAYSTSIKTIFCRSQFKINITKTARLDEMEVGGKHVPTYIIYQCWGKAQNTKYSKQLSAVKSDASDTRLRRKVIRVLVHGRERTLLPSFTLLPWHLSCSPSPCTRQQFPSLYVVTWLPWANIHLSFLHLPHFARLYAHSRQNITLTQLNAWLDKGTPLPSCCSWGRLSWPHCGSRI